jgi:hypothetical protein
LTIVQTLANGATITRTFTSKEAQGSEGRTYSETHQTLLARADGQPVELINYHVFDPVARTHINWGNQTKIAGVTHMPEPETADAARLRQVVRPTQHVTREDLGVRSIAGIEAKGTRTTSLIPASDVGNNRPLNIVTENWISMQYHIPLLTITDDPRTGKRTDEVIKFQPGEPDPALFQIPEGDTVREHTAGP